MNLTKIEKTEELIVIYTKLLDKEIKELSSEILKIQKKMDTLNDKKTAHSLGTDLQYLHGKVETKVEVYRELKLMLKKIQLNGKDIKTE